MSNLVQYLNQYVHDHKIESTDKSIKIKPITTGQMKSLLVYEDTTDNNKIEEILDEIIIGCVPDPEFVLDDLTLQDRFDLLIDIRKVTKGKNYQFNTKCPKCGTEMINNIDLTKLERVDYNPSMDSKVELTPTMSVHLHPVTRGIQKEAISLVGKLKGLTDKQRMAETATYIYALAMTKFNTPAGVVDDASVEDKRELLDSLPESIYKNINKWFEDSDYGMKFTYSSVCVNNDWSGDDLSIPVSGFFF